MDATLTALRPDLGLYVCAWLDAKRGGIPLSTVLVRLDGGELLAYSPTRGMSDETHAAIASLGRVAFLVCPNHFHFMGVREWKRRYPDAVVCASPRATVRLAKKAAVPPDPAAWERLGRALPAHVRLLVPEGTRNGEVWIELDDARGPVWVVCDAWFHISHHLGGVLGLLCRVLRITGGLQVGLSWKWLACHPKPYRAWALAALAERRPTLLVPSHGDVVDGDDVPARLRAALVATLGEPPP
jgi:hypothetical protein